MSDSYYYKNHLPVLNEFVMAKIASISDIGVMCILLEYNNLEALLSFSEISRKNVRCVYNLVRVGQKHVFQVINISNNNVDLSKKFLDQDEISMGKEKYKNGKAVYNICKYIGELKGVTQQEVYDSIVLPLCGDYEYPYDAFKLLASGTNIYENHDVNQEYVQSLVAILKQRMTVHPVKIVALVDVTCFTGGITAIKNALLTAQTSAPKDFDIKIHLHASPTFIIHTITIDEVNGIIAINNVIERIKEEIIKNDGEFKLKEEAHVLVQQ
jgi:translation initiation factor 2 alpha subunit (eIF-2alpha)